MTMQQQQKKKSKKSLEQLIEELKSVTKKMAVIYLPEIAEAVEHEHPEWDMNRKREFVSNAFTDNGWNAPYIDRVIRQFAPQLNEGNARCSGQVTRWKNANENKLKASNDKFINDVRNIPDPPEPKEPEQKYTPLDDEELDKELHSMQMDKFGTTGKSIREIYGDITHYANGLFETLTQKEMPYADNVDRILDYIKPSREYWRSLMLEFDETKRARTHNELSFLAELIEDRLQIISEVKDK